jgi:iron complex transport system permease protein
VSASGRRALAGFSGAAAALVLLVAVAFLVGRYPVTPGQLIAVLWAKAIGTTPVVPATVPAVILGVRGPRVLAALAVGAALAIAGAAYQGLFRNPLVSPDILGVSSGAALGAVLGIYLSLAVVLVQLLAFAVGGSPRSHSGCSAAWPG